MGLYVTAELIRLASHQIQTKKGGMAGHSRASFSGPGLYRLVHVAPCPSRGRVPLHTEAERTLWEHGTASL